MITGRGIIFALLSTEDGIRSIPVDVEYIREERGALEIIDLAIPYHYLKELDSEQVETVLQLVRKRLEKKPL